MASYYYAPDGLPGNTGTSSGSPWDYPGSFVGKTFAAGDQIFFKSGGHFYGPGIQFGATIGVNGTTVRVNSTAATPTKFNIYGGTDRAVFHGQDGWSFNDLSGIEVNYLEFSGTWKRGDDPYGWGGWGLSWYGFNSATTASHVYFNNCVAHDFWYGIFADCTQGSTLTDFQINDCEAHHNALAGIATAGIWDTTMTTFQFDNVKVQRCTTYRNYGDPLKTDNHSGNGIVLGQCKNSLIDQCLAYENGGSDAGPSGPVGIWFWGSKDSTIQRCVSCNNRRGANVPFDGGGFDVDIDSKNITVQYNVAFGNEGSGILIYHGAASTNTGSVVRFNICYGNNLRPVSDNSGEMSVGGNVTGLLVYNNTFVSTVSAIQAPALCLSNVGTHSGCRYLNNILVAPVGSLTVINPNSRAATEHLLQGNCYWRADGSAAYKIGASTYGTLPAVRAIQATQEMVSATPVGYHGNPKLEPFIGAKTPLSLETDDVMPLQSGSPVATIAQNVLTVAGVSPGTRDISNTTLRTTNGSLGALQAPLLALNTAGIPTLTRVTVTDERGSALDFVAGTPQAVSERIRTQLLAMKNASSVAYFVQT